MLHTIDEQGNIFWHCRKATCSYHNCAEWDAEVTCEAHPTKNVQGQTHTAHMSDPDVQWTGPDHINLPACQECTERKGLTIHTDLAEPVIKTDELTGKILQVTMPVGYEHHGNLWIIDGDIVHTPVPHPTLAHLSTEEIQTMQEQMKAKAPDAPTEWMLTHTIRQDIHKVYPHPAVARHRELARQLQAIGKVYQDDTNQPGTVAPTPDEG